jgi:predicted regulator of Ras-like GTPase activity (Roadblock/LC7/MglB family)
MTIPFLDIFKRVKARFRQAAVRPVTPPARGVPVEKKPSSERLSKTVMPNKARPATAAPDAYRGAGAAAPNTKLPESGLRMGGKRDLPPAVALALQPKVERAISLKLSDFLEQVPKGFLKSADTFNTNRRILLKASEIEKGMATGRPAVSMATIYEQAPEIFMHSLPAGDATDVELPLDKVMEQFQSVHVREDQERDQDVPQLETPFLQVTIEDTERFGTTVAALQTSAHPPVKVEPATAKTLSTAEPEPVARETAASPTSQPRGIPLDPPVSRLPKQPPVPQPESAGATRIPFQLPPSGAGASALEKVPASSGPPVPNPLPKTPAPARIPFKISPPSDALRPKLTLVPGVERPASEAKPEAAVEAVAPPPSVAQSDDGKIALGLQAIMQALPAFQLKDGAETIPADVRVELPLSQVEPQLAGGRVEIPAKTFQAAVPEKYREFFVVDATETPVLLPLQEILKNLPASALKMRADQEVVQAREIIETPFSIKAAEDAKRFSGPSATGQTLGEVEAEARKTEESPVSKPADAAQKKEEKPAAAPEGSASAAKPEEKAKIKAGEKVAEPGTAAQPATTGEKKTESKSEEKNEAKQVVEKASALPGVAACSVTFSDGLSLAGNLPVEVEAEGLCAMAPSLLERIDRHMRDTKLGPLTSMTLHGAKSPVTFFMKGNVCLTVLHAGGDLAAETQDRLAEMAKELSRTYSQPEAVHVDH